jgi:hypothetical protein
MEALVNLAKRAVSLDENRLLNQILSRPDIQQRIITMNRVDQLYNRGIDSEGDVLRSDFAQGIQVYADYTIFLKEIKDQKTDVVTLSDTGDFYNSFHVRINLKDFEIVADDVKADDLVATWGPVLGLTEENMQRLIDILREDLIPVIKMYLLNAA